MSSSNRSLDYLPSNEAAFRTLRRGGDQGQPAGYFPENDEMAKGWPGDAKFPFTMQPPDLEPPELYRDSRYLDDSGTTNPLPLVAIGAGPAGYQTLREIDVRGYRLLVLYLLYTAGMDGEIGTLSLLPEAAISINQAGAWFGVGVVDPTLVTVGVAPVLDSVLPPNYAYRTMRNTELRVEALAEVPLAMTVSFDVTSYATFRLRCADVLTENSALDLYTARLR